MKDYFNVWSVAREDVATANMDEDDNEWEGAYKLTDEQMEDIANRMQRYLEYSMDDYWEAVRDATSTVLGDKVK